MGKEKTFVALGGEKKEESYLDPSVTQYTGVKELPCGTAHVESAPV
jgi:hypothetical protein